MSFDARTIHSVVVCGYNHYGYVEAIAAGFDRLEGVEGTSVCHDSIAYSKTRSRSFVRRLRYRGRSRRLNEAVVRAVEEREPDLVVAIEGACLSPETVRRLGASRGVVLWCLDPLSRLGTSRDQLRAYHAVLTFEPADRALWPEVLYLPVGYDDRVYRVLPDAEKKFDLVWVGSLHPDRVARLEQISGWARKVGIRFGVFGPIYKRRHRRRFARTYPALYRSTVENSRFRPAEVNRIFNESLLALNLHSPEAEETAFNPRTWEATAAGAVVLTDWKEAMRGEIRDGENAYVYRSLDHLKNMLPSILQDRARLSAVRRQGLEEAKQKHTFAHRSRALLQLLEEREVRAREEESRQS